MGALIDPAGRTESLPSDEATWAVAASVEAWNQAFVTPPPPHRVGIFLGSTLGYPSGRAVAAALGVTGPVVSISTACTSSAHALGMGRDMIQAGDIDAAVVGGVDRVSPSVLAGFTALGVLHPERCTPFSGAPGTSLGEGAGLLVLVRSGLAKKARWTFYGYGLAADGYHETSPHPLGSGTLRAVRHALDDATLAPSSVDYVSAHGTGTGPNDASEARALRDAFDPPLPFASQKGHFGHTLAAAGALETISTLLAMSEEKLLPTLCHGTQARPDCVLPALAGTELVSAPARVSVGVNAAFGGLSSAVVVGRLEGAAEPSPRPVRPVSCVGVGFVDDGANSGPASSLARVAPRVDPRELDAGATWLVRASALALDDAGLRLRGPARSRTGAAFGVAGASPDSIAAYEASLCARGVEGASAPAFARIVAHAPGGAVSRGLGLLGPFSCILGSSTAPLVAALQAVRWLRVRTDVDRVVVGGYTSAAPGEVGKRAEGGAALVFSAVEPGGVTVSGEGLAGSLEEAVTAALGAAGIDASAIDRVVGPRGLTELVPTSRGETVDGKDTGTLSGAVALGTAVEHLRRSRARRVLVAGYEPHLAAALIFESKEALA
ncbi:MAG: beta-ketoacyl synthase N-terminal-like domain-containing protein [Myxococcota bacterium]